MSKIVMLSVFLNMLGKTLSFYNKSYNGYTFILPDVVVGRGSWLMQLSFSEAQEWCMKNVAGSTLATILNKDVQENFGQFIKHIEQFVINRYSNIRLSGQYYITDEWRWVNGRLKNTDITVHRLNAELYNSYGRLHTTNFNIYAAFHTLHRYGYFICEYPGNSAECDLFLNGRCYKKKDSWSKWYDARNECLDGGGDLASFETLSDKNINVSLRNLSLSSHENYWIGLQKNEWRWKDTGSAIKYTNWESNRPSNYSLRCLCLTQYQWQLKECDCTERYPFICSLKDMNDSPTSNDILRNSSEKNKFVIIIASCAAIVFVTIIIVAALIIKKRRNSDGLQPFVSRVVKSSGYESPKPAVTESSMDFPVYAEIQQPKADTTYVSDTTYASVQMTAGTDQEQPVNNVVYAELDLTSRA